VSTSPPSPTHRVYFCFLCAADASLLPKYLFAVFILTPCFFSFFLCSACSAKPLLLAVGLRPDCETVDAVRIIVKAVEGVGAWQRLRLPAAADAAGAAAGAGALPPPLQPGPIDFERAAAAAIAAAEKEAAAAAALSGPDAGLADDFSSLAVQ
jgi:hypothetical protein